MPTIAQTTETNSLVPNINLPISTDEDGNISPVEPITSAIIAQNGALSTQNTLSPRQISIDQTKNPEGDSILIEGAEVHVRSFAFEAPQSESGAFSASPGQTPRPSDPSKNLRNAHVVHLGNEKRAMIRHGKMSTSDSKAQFKALILELHSKGLLEKSPNGKYRVTSTSLLASWGLMRSNFLGNNVSDFFSLERDWVVNQHQFIEELKTDPQILAANIELVHLQYQIHSSIDKESVGLTEGIALENLSLEINRKGLASYVQYFMEDLKPGQLPPQLREKYAEVQKLLADLKNDVSKEMSFFDKVLELLQLLLYGWETANLEGNLTSPLFVPTREEKIKQGLELVAQIEADATDSKTKAMAHALQHLISGNLNRSKVSRHQEMISLAILNQGLGINSAYNCKSGADRTGLVHATESAISQMILKGGWDSVLPLVSNFDENADALDKATETMNSTEYSTYIAAPETPLQQKAVAEFRSLVYKNMMNVGNPIVKGYMEHEGFKFSNHPLVAKFIPRFVEVNNKPLQLTERVGILWKTLAYTKEGKAHLIGNSKKRKT